MPRANLTPRLGWQPGVSPADSEGAWWRTNLVRRVGATWQPIGGWASIPGFKLNDAVRELQSWRDNANTRWMAAASLGQVMVYAAGTATDVTPADFVAGNPAGIRQGYGIGAYGRGSYGTKRTTVPLWDMQGAQGDTLHLDTWGENLVITGSLDQRILWWQPSVGGLAVPIPPAAATPEETPGIVHVVPPARFAFATDERFLVAVGANGDPKQVAWSDQERPGAWTADIANQAGSKQLTTTGIPRMAKRTPYGPIIWCDTDIHQMVFVGPPDAYGIRRIGTGCSAISAEAIIVTAQATAWMGEEAFWTFAGGTPTPILCPVQQYVFDNLNQDTKGRVTGGFNGLYPEFWWFYPDKQSVEPNRYVVWNFQTNQWYGGAMGRTALFEPAAYGNPTMGDRYGQVWFHEYGWYANGQPRGQAVYLETGDIVLGQGDEAAYLAQLMPDTGGLVTPQFHLFGRWEPQDIDEDWGLYPYTRSDGLIDVDREARRLRIRVVNVDAPTDTGPPWRLGQLRADMRPGAGR